MEKAKFHFRSGLITEKIVNKKYYSKRKRFFRRILELKLKQIVLSIFSGLDFTELVICTKFN